MPALRGPEAGNPALGHKTVVYGALAYFLIPLDAIPDAVFVIGYSDDLAVLSAALVTISLYVDVEVEQQADCKVREWFG